VLYDRARLSLKNDWVADGKIYTVYPIADLAETLGKSESTIKSMLNELDEMGLLIRKSGGFSKANILYVLVPSIGQFSDEVTKLHSKGRKRKPYKGELSGPAEDGFSATNKVSFIWLLLRWLSSINLKLLLLRMCQEWQRCMRDRLHLL